jgi:hypothetical protein
MKYDTKTENFLKAFDTHCGGIRRTCECGREFYNYMDANCFDPGELQDLQADPTATGLDYTIDTFLVEGKEYVIDCDCWHGRVATLIAWIDAHGRHIAEYLTLEKQRLLREANAAPTVEPNEKVRHGDE